MWKFKKLLIWLSVFAFVLCPACGIPPKTTETSTDSYYTIQSGYGSDGYRMVNASIMQTQIDLNLHMFRSYEEFRKIKKELKVKDPEGGVVQAFTYYSLENNRCDVFILDPAFEYDPETIGHELVHCIYGDFHKGQNVGIQVTKVGDE